MAVKHADTNEDVADGYESIEHRIARWLDRDPTEFANAHARLFALLPDPRALPPGKSLEDVTVGQWPGDETDEDIIAFLEDLS